MSPRQKLRSGRYPLAFALRKIIENANAVATVEKSFDHVTSDEAGAAGNQNEIIFRGHSAVP